MSNHEKPSLRPRGRGEDSFILGFKFTLGAVVAIGSVVAAVLVALFVMWSMTEAGRSYFAPREKPSRPGNPWRSD